MTCPNGCGELEAEDHVDSNGAAFPYGPQINRIYRCETCDYEAIWRKNVGRGERHLEVLFPGIGRDA